MTLRDVAERKLSKLGDSFDRAHYPDIAKAGFCTIFSPLLLLRSFAAGSRALLSELRDDTCGSFVTELFNGGFF